MHGRMGRKIRTIIFVTNLATEFTLTSFSGNINHDYKYTIFSKGIHVSKKEESRSKKHSINRITALK